MCFWINLCLFYNYITLSFALLYLIYFLFFSASEKSFLFYNLYKEKMLFCSLSDQWHPDEHEAKLIFNKAWPTDPILTESSTPRSDLTVIKVHLKWQLYLQDSFVNVDNSIIFHGKKVLDQICANPGLKVFSKQLLLHWDF